MSVASSTIFSRQASRSTRKFSFSNSSGVSARVFLDLFDAFFSGGGAQPDGALDVETAVVVGVYDILEETTVEYLAEEDTGGSGT